MVLEIYSYDLFQTCICNDMEIPEDLFCLLQAQPKDTMCISSAFENNH